MLIADCWLLVVGCWLLVVGCWLLVVGYLINGAKLSRRKGLTGKIT
jgi:dephospho-CoA kinase